MFLPPPDGVSENVKVSSTPASDGSLPNSRDTPNPTGPQVKHAFEGCPDSINSLIDRVNNIRSTNFPLYPPAGIADSGGSQSVSIAKLPVSLCWVMRERPRTFDRVTRKSSFLWHCCQKHTSPPHHRCYMRSCGRASVHAML
jgi:hypothetical protein